MKRSLIIATVLTLGTSASGFAMGCDSHKAQKAMSCAEGSTWDSATQSCVPQVSS